MSELKISVESGLNDWLECKTKEGDIILGFEEAQNHDRRKEEHA